jgi:hypothetical protein
MEAIPSSYFSVGEKKTAASDGTAIAFRHHNFYPSF